MPPEETSADRPDRGDGPEGGGGDEGAPGESPRPARRRSGCRRRLPPPFDQDRPRRPAGRMRKLDACDQPPSPGCPRPAQILRVGPGQLYWWCHRYL